MGLRADPLLPAQARGRQPRHPASRSASIAFFASQVAPYGYDEIPFTDPLKLIENPNLVAESINQPPTTRDWHLFGTDNVGRDYLSRVIFGLRTSLWVAVFVALLSTVIGTFVGALAGYYGGTTDNLLMRFTDLILTIPGLAVLLTAAAFLGQDDSEVFGIPLSQTIKIGLILAFLFWTVLARIVRGTFLSLREKEYVEAAKASGASDARIIVRHMLPNTLGPIIVNMTLVIATAILVEAALSFLGFGIQPPKPALGSLIAQGQAEGFETLVARHLPGHRDRRSSPSASTSSATGCAMRSTRRSGGFVAEPVLSLKELTVEFDTEDGIVKAVTDVSYDLHPGEVLGVVGESGSGKSVSVMSVLGLIPAGRVVKGEALYKGRDLLKLPQKELRRDPRRRGGDDLPGPDDLAEPGADDRRPDRRGGQGAQPGHGRRRGPEARRSSSSSSSACRSPSAASTSIRTSSPAACGSAR